MTKATEGHTTPRKPDGVLTRRTDRLTIITEVFFNHDSKETFQDRLIKAVLADRPK